MGRRAVERKRSARKLLTISLVLVPLGLLGAGAVGTRAEPADSDAHSQRPPAVSDDQRAVGALIHEVLSAARKRDFVALDRLMAAEFHSRADGSEGSKASALELFRRQPSLLDGIASSIEYGCGSASFGDVDLWLCPPLQTEEKVLQPQRVGFRRLGEGRWTFWFYVPETAGASTAEPASSTAAAGSSDPDCERRIVEEGGPCLDGTASSRSGELPAPSREILGFRLGEHSFEDARRLFGNAERWHSGDAAASEDKLCYVTRAGEEQATLVLSSNSEMSGGAIDGMTVIAGPTGFVQRCLALSSRRPAEMETRSGLRLGMSVAEMEAVLGRPTEVRGQFIFYMYCSEKTIERTDPAYERCKDGDRAEASRCSGLTAQFENGRLKWMEIGYGADFFC